MDPGPFGWFAVPLTLPGDRRWSEVTRRLELWIQILEINENGDFVPVEVVPARDVRTGGIFQLRQVETSALSSHRGRGEKPAHFNTASVAPFFLCRPFRASRGESRWTCAPFRTRARCL